MGICQQKARCATSAMVLEFWWFSEIKTGVLWHKAALKPWFC